MSSDDDDRVSPAQLETTLKPPPPETRSVELGDRLLNEFVEGVRQLLRREAAARLRDV